MCNQKRIYRITLNSLDILEGNTSSGKFMIKLPYKVNKATIVVESAIFINGGALHTNHKAIKICAPSFYESGHFYSDQRQKNTLIEIPFKASNLDAGNNVFYENSYSLNTAGTCVENLDLDNKPLILYFLGNTNAVIVAGDITSYSITILIIDDEPSALQY